MIIIQPAQIYGILKYVEPSPTFCPTKGQAADHRLNFIYYRITVQIFENDRSADNSSLRIYCYCKYYLST